MHHTRRPQQGGQHQPAQRQEIHPASDQKSQHMVNTNLSAVPQEGQGEQRRHNPQPKQQIQHESQDSQADAPAQGAHPIVHQAQQRPQQDPLPENSRLGRDIHVHGQRSSRDRNPPRTPPPSSS